jgi:predicted PurR-regulated permease PerM
MKRLALGTLIVFGVLLGLYVLWLLRGPVLIFFLSLMLAAAVRPMTDYLPRTGLRGQIGVTGVYLLGLLLAGAGLLLLGSLLLGELQRAGGDFVRALEQVGQRWPQGTWLQQLLSRALPAPQAVLAEITGPQMARFAQAVLGTAFSVFGTAVDLLVIVVLSIYWTTDRVHFERLWLSLLPVGPRAGARDAWRGIEQQVGAYLRNEFLGSILVGGLLLPGLMLAGFSYPALMAVTGALAWLVPWLGGLFAMIGALTLSVPALVLVDGGRGVALAVFACVYTAGIFLAVDLLVERRYRARARFNSLLMAIVVIGLADTLGILGLVLGPPLAVGLQVLFEQLARRRAADESRPTPTIDDRLAALRRQIGAVGGNAPEMANIVRRLSELVEQTREVLPAAESPAALENG